MTPRALVAVAALIVPLALAGCSDGSDDTGPDAGRSSVSSSAPSSTGPSYVALGDSYAAAPGVPTTSGADGCFRSDHNYARLLAEDADLALTDVTCSGATTDDVAEKQVPSLGPSTRLVTLGIGGNDDDLFARLLGACVHPEAFDDPGTPCTDAIGTELTQTVPTVRRNVADLVDAVVEAAPRARVVLVGYPQLLPTSGTCPDRVSLAAGDYPLLNRLTAALSTALRDAAASHDLDFVDLGPPSRGHDICADDPWINGSGMAPDGTIPFHPFAAEQAAVADLLADLVPTA